MIFPLQSGWLSRRNRKCGAQFGECALSAPKKGRNWRRGSPSTTPTLTFVGIPPMGGRGLRTSLAAPLGPPLKYLREKSEQDEGVPRCFPDLSARLPFGLSLVHPSSQQHSVLICGYVHYGSDFVSVREPMPPPLHNALQGVESWRKSMRRPIELGNTRSLFSQTGAESRSLRWVCR